MLAAVVAVLADEETATWTTKPGFIPGTKPDVETGFMTVDEAKHRCAMRHECLAITFREAADVKGKLHIYLKADSTVSESDRTWTSMVKRPAGLMDVSFFNPLPIPLELCWIALEGGARPACYGTVAPGAAKNMSSFSGHHFVLKQLAWSARAADVLHARGDVPIAERLRAHEWETPASLRADAPPPPAAPPPPPLSVSLRNTLSKPVEVCTAPQWATRLLYSAVPPGLDACHGVAGVGQTLAVPLREGEALLARKLIGVVAIEKGVLEYTLQEQQLSPAFTRKLVDAMLDGPRPPPPPAEPPPPRAAAADSSAAAFARVWTRPPPPLRRASRFFYSSLPCAPHSPLPSIQTCAPLERSVAAAALLFPAVDAAANGQPFSLPPSCNEECSALASAVGLDATLSESHPRLMRLVLQLASSSISSGGGDAMEVTMFAPHESVPSLSPFHALVALRAAGVRRASLRLLHTAAGGAPPPPPLAAWACALGLELHLSSLAVPALRLDPAPPPHPPHLLLLSAATAAEAWDVLAPTAPRGGAVLGQLPARGLTYTFVATPADAMALHLSAGARPLGGVTCARCEALVRAALANRCRLFGAAVEEGTWQVLTVLHELAAAWPIGYRVEERCESIGDALGLGSAHGVQALCAFQGCMMLS
ncbi:hypothetical protein AB1Y20_015850 [Prymnesium parvum]|uniref:C-type lectin domain-containing protein n=1 Tax=Prymnesium parvum TaxID=97485 RepID=A0AB34K2L7_PRYPA